MITSQTALIEAIALTDEILAVLETQNWGRMSELEKQRQPLIQQAFNQSVEQIDQIKAMHLQNLNQQVVDKLSEFKQAVLQQQRQIQNGSKATRAYGSHQL